MSIRFIYGRAGIGKSTWCINSIAENIKKMMRITNPHST